MEKKALFFVPMFVLVASLFLSGFAQAGHHPTCNRVIPAIVDTAWVEKHSEKLVILDIRSPGEYAAGHIPNAISKPFVDPQFGGAPISEWIIINKDGLLLEVPNKQALFNTIGSLGIDCYSWVVILTAPNPDPALEPPFYGLANGTRVALTLIYAGVKNVAILDGGYPKWVTDGGGVTTAVPTVEPSEYNGKVNKAMLVSMQYVKKSIRKAAIIDARDADVYFGVTIEPFALKEGHIPSAKSLPAPWIWELDETKTYYTYKDPEILSAMASGVIGEPWSWKAHLRQEVIVYCGVGGYASSWWFVLTQVLGYQNVKLYDGAAQEWVLYYDMVPYQWD